MSKEYSKLGFKAGLEIHQQLDTPKLFSGSPSFLRNDEPHYKIERKLHVVAGETGKIDEAVKHEATLGKTFVYEGYRDSISLVELDEEPPHKINQEALDVALTVALLLNCEIYPVTQVMRKTVIDGSNTSGFQRTALIARNGFVETSLGKVRIATICIEEDSARVILREKEKVVYRLDRLGIPLVEIATYPDLQNAEQVKECALKLGEILRACHVKRGLGTIRQDVNISISGHDRVEIKGFQDPKMMIETIDKEIDRQIWLPIISKFMRKFKGYNDSIPKIINNSSFVKLIGLKSCIKELNVPEDIILNFLSDFSKIHSKNELIILEGNSFEESFVKDVFCSLDADINQDIVLLIKGNDLQDIKALNVVISRANSLFNQGSFPEVRNALSSGESEFLRPMPGASRMYPETDLNLLRIGLDKINQLKKNLPKLKTDIRDELRKKGLTDELIGLVLESHELLDEFELLLQIYPLDSPLVAKMVTLWRNEFATKRSKTFEEIKSILSERVYEQILEEVALNKINSKDVKFVLTKILDGEKLANALKIEKISDDEIEELVRKIIRDKPGMRANAYMGMLMAQFKGKLDAKKAMELVDSVLNTK